jgi:hypothetical protein
MCVITAHGVRCLVCWLVEVRCRVAGYASGMNPPSRNAFATMHGQTHIKFTELNVLLIYVSVKVGRL